MKKIIALVVAITIALVVITSSFCVSSNEKNKPTKIENSIKIEKLMGPIDNGLHNIQLNDSTNILFYRGTESCTMIKLN